MGVLGLGREEGGLMGGKTVALNGTWKAMEPRGKCDAPVTP